MDYLIANSLLSKEQHGFMAGPEILCHIIIAYCLEG